MSEGDAAQLAALPRPLEPEHLAWLAALLGIDLNEEQL